jgi:glycosyltransferase involved in cell wall biosynthesis
MRILFDGLAITGDSLAIVAEHLVTGWDKLPDGDELHIIVGPGNEAPFPSDVTVHEVPFGKRTQLSRIRAQNRDLPKLARELKADVVIGLLPTTTVARLPCPRVIMAYDLRHELRPQQFSRMNRAQRKISYTLGWRQSDGIAVISERTKADLLKARPWLAKRPLRLAWLGADHTDAWPRDSDAEPYALAFGQYFNKNVDLVIDAWALLRDRGPVMPLTVVGLGQAARTAAQAKVEELGLTDLVRVLPWLSIEEFRGTFASASLVVFPSDFEGFGLPAAEAMRIGIPVVITPEPALLEITAGHATVMDGWDAKALADAVVASRETTPDQIKAARVHADQFTWESAAADVRAVVVDATR